jgi:glucose-6-phosphate 1-dehydrogenase
MNFGWLKAGRFKRYGNMPEMTTIIILGASGDLARHRLIPAFFALYDGYHLPDDFQIFGISRSLHSDDELRTLARAGASTYGSWDARQSKWDQFAAHLHAVSVDIQNLDGYAALKERLQETERGFQPANRLFYLSIAPALYEHALRNLGLAGLAREDSGWRRVIVEKPFGSDGASAQALDRILHQTFAERQIYHIDHYLGKETVQNLLVFRFANSIFEPLWNRNYIDHVQLTVTESVTVGGRAGYYDSFGVVRDMVQNHLLQLLTLVAMEPPSVIDAESLREKKVEVLKAIRRWDSPDQALGEAVAGQYQGYLQEKGVFSFTSTPTYAAVRLFIDNWRWQGVPFYLRTGKAMATKVSEIVIQFRNPPLSMFSLGPGQRVSPNILAICLQPGEGARLRFVAKTPGQGMSTRPVNMSFQYETAFGEQSIPDAYEHLLWDALMGDASDFLRSDQIEEAWRIVDPLLRAWEDPNARLLHIYDRGSWGPEAANRLLEQDGRAWIHACSEGIAS